MDDFKAIVKKKPESIRALENYSSLEFDSLVDSSQVNSIVEKEKAKTGMGIDRDIHSIRLFNFEKKPQPTLTLNSLRIGSEVYEWKGDFFKYFVNNDLLKDYVSFPAKSTEADHEVWYWLIEKIAFTESKSTALQAFRVLELAIKQPSDTCDRPICNSALGFEKFHSILEAFGVSYDFDRPIESVKATSFDYCYNLGLIVQLLGLSLQHRSLFFTKSNQLDCILHLSYFLLDHSLSSIHLQALDTIQILCSNFPFTKTFIKEFQKRLQEKLSNKPILLESLLSYLRWTEIDVSELCNEWLVQLCPASLSLVEYLVSLEDFSKLSFLLTLVYYAVKLTPEFMNAMKIIDNNIGNITDIHKSRVRTKILRLSTKFDSKKRRANLFK